MMQQLASCGERVAIYEPCVILRPENVHLGDDVRLDSFTKLEGGMGTSIGRGVHVSSFAHIGIGGGRLIVGDYAGIASGARVLSGTNKPSGPSMSASAPASLQVVERYTTTIGNYAFVGAGATVMPGVTIGEGGVVAAGAVVTRDVEPWTIVAGTPARLIRRRERAPA